MHCRFQQLSPVKDSESDIAKHQLDLRFPQRTTFEVDVVRTRSYAAGRLLEARLNVLRRRCCGRDASTVTARRRSPRRSGS